MKQFLIWKLKQKNHEIYVTVIKVSKILLQFVLFYDTLTVYAENRIKRQNLQILVFTGVGLLTDLLIKQISILAIVACMFVIQWCY